MKPAILSANTSYTFSDYFNWVDYLEDILAYFAYSYDKQQYQLPRYPKELASLPLLKARLEKNLPYISLTNEAAKREFLIAPLLMELIDHTQARIKVEFSLTLNDQLKGTLDYYLQAQNNLLVIEANNSDLERGFVQLAVELIALDQWTDSPASHLYGAVSTGEIWRFGILERVTKHITQDLNLFRVPADLEELMRSLVAILKV